MTHSGTCAEIIAIGSELLGPSRADTNSLALTKLLNEFGINVRFKTIVGDTQFDLTHVYRQALDRAQIVISTGGLGPTDDDLSREAAAEALGLSLSLNTKALEELENRYRNAGVVFRENSRKQAMQIEGSELIPNGPGSAPGTFFQNRENMLILLPGVPREMQFMADTFIRQKLNEQFAVNNKHSIIINLASVPESLVDSQLEQFNFRKMNVEYTILASLMRVQIILKSTSKNVLSSMKSNIIRLFGSAYFGDGELSLEEAVLNRLTERHETLAVSESCTGGLLSKMLTDVPGSSKVFKGGVICYSNQLKEEFLSVDKELMIRHGAVSAQVASVLSSEIMLKTGSDYGIGITGVAGPSQSEAKPRGLVFISVSGKDRTLTYKTQMSGTREMVRQRSVRFALDMLRKLFLMEV